MKIYGDEFSGNCYKLKLMCTLLGLEYDWVPIDIMRGDTRDDDFLALNPVGQIPVCITADDEKLTESNAILYYLAADSAFWPKQKLRQSQVLQWQFFEQYSHEPSVAVARFIMQYQGMPDDRQAEYEAKLKAGYRALDVMERHLQRGKFFVGNECSIADISLFAYTHVAEEGGFELSSYAAIRTWIDRIKQLPGFIAMPASASGPSIVH